MRAWSARIEGSDGAVSVMQPVDDASGQRARRGARQRTARADPGSPHRAARVGVVLVPRRLEERRPGLTGVSHWVEHMNFKGTTNIPRDKVKGIIEQFGGYWNGYTWIDQTTYTETATRDVLDRMLFIESERMANCLYDPGRLRVGADGDHLGAAGRRERSRPAPRSGADGHGVSRASVRPSDHRLARRSADDDARRSLRLLPPPLRPEQRDARHRRRRRSRTRRCDSVVRHFGCDPAWRRREDAADTRAGTARRAPRDRVARGHDGLPEGRLSRAVGSRPRLLSAARARCGADGRQGRQPVGELPHAAAAAQRAAVSRARRRRVRVRGERRSHARRRNRSSTRSR